jgi:hypothetical protein
LRQVVPFSRQRIDGCAAAQDLNRVFVRSAQTDGVLLAYVAPVPAAPPAAGFQITPDWRRFADPALSLDPNHPTIQSSENAYTKA